MPAIEYAMHLPAPRVQVVGVADPQT